jgi:hypothetical protein
VAVGWLSAVKTRLAEHLLVPGSERTDFRLRCRVLSQEVDLQLVDPTQTRRVRLVDARKARLRRRIGVERRGTFLRFAANLYVAAVVAAEKASFVLQDLHQI